MRAEIEHHLACAEREGIERGLASEPARHEALERFGDVAATRAACVRIQTGERIMLQRIHLAVTVLLLVAVLALAWNAQRSSRAAAQAAEAAAALRAEVAQRALLPRQAPAPVAHVIVEVGDRVQFVDQYNPDEIKGVVEVAQDGKIPVPEVGWVFVAGMTREEAEQTLTRALEPYFVESDVRVIVQKAPVTSFQSVMFQAF